MVTVGSPQPITPNPPGFAVTYGIVSPPQIMYPPNKSRANVRPNIIRSLAVASATLAAACLSANGQTSFTHSIGFDDMGYQHGSIVEPGAYSGFQYLSPQISVTPPQGGFNKAVIFDTVSAKGDSRVEDQDLIPNGIGNRGNANYGNVAIIQENTSFTVSNGRINDPFKKVDDHANGGKFTFDLNPGASVTVDAIRVDLIDIESAGQIKIVAYGANGSFTWTGADLKAMDNSIVYADKSANRTSFLTASQAGLSSITKFDIVSTTSFAVDNLTFKGTVVPEVSSSFLTAASGLLLCFRRRRQS